MIEYNPEAYDLSSWMHSIVEVYEQDFDAYWELGEHPSESEFTDEQRARHRKLRQLGLTLFRVVRSLDAGDAQQALLELFDHSPLARNFTPDDHAALLRALHQAPIVRHALAIELASEAAASLLPLAEERAARLVSLISAHRPNERAIAYLDRATWLYLWGFDAECEIMCRSALEAALVARLDEALDLDEPPPGLEQLLKLAGMHGLLEGYAPAPNRRGWSASRQSDMWRADRLRWSANQLVHHLPVMQRDRDAIGDGHTALAELMHILNVLFSRGA